MRKYNYEGLTFRAVLVPRKPDPFRALINAVKDLKPGVALEVSCPPALRKALSPQLYAAAPVGRRAHLHYTGPGRFVVWTMPKVAKAAERGK